MRPPNSDTSSSPISLRRQLLRQYLTQVLNGNKKIRRSRHGNTVTLAALRRMTTVVVVIMMMKISSFLLGRWSRRRTTFFRPISSSSSCCFGGGGRRRRRRHRHEEVNLATLELGIGRDGDDLRNDAVVRGRRRGRFLEEVLGVSLHDVAGSDGAADFLHAAVGVDDPDDVECTAW